MSMSMLAHSEVRYALSGFSERWTISEEPVPESAWHHECLDLLKALLVAWLTRTGRNAYVYYNLAMRVRADRPQVGFDPDLMIVEPAPPERGKLDSLLLWRSDHIPPVLVVEVVSPNHPHKDYAETPEKCAVAGVAELVVFDPLLAGPRTGAGPHLLQQWLRQPDGSFVRSHAGSGSARSPVLDASWQPDRERRRLLVSDDAAGLHSWLTGEQTERAGKEAERAGKEAERAEKEAERAEKESALRRIAELEAQLARSR
jgi:Uma2 family endonuclease